MSLFKALNVISWTIGVYENIKTWVISKKREWRTKRIRRLVDDGNVDDVHKLVQDIKRKRRKRRDAS